MEESDEEWLARIRENAEKAREKARLKEERGFVDYFGNKLEVGKRVVFASTSGRSGRLSTCHITELLEPGEGYNERTRRVRVRLEGGRSQVLPYYACKFYNLPEEQQDAPVLEDKW